MMNQSFTDSVSVESVEDWQKEVMEEEPMEEWQKEVMKEEEEELMEDCQMEVMVKDKPMEDRQKKLTVKMDPLEQCQKEVMEKVWQKKLKVEVETMEDFQNEVTSMKNHLNEVETIKGFQKEAKSTKNFQKKAESIKDFQKKVEYIDDCQKEGREDYMEKNGEGCRRYKARHELKRSTEGLNSHKKRRTGMSLPFPLLVGLSPTGFLSANKKKPGGPDDVIQVNGKQYPLAKIKLGRMGALHPANRLAAYLTGRVGSTKQRQSSSSSEPSCNLQSIPHVTSSAYCVPPAPAASTVASAVVQSQPPATQPTLATPLATSLPTPLSTPSADSEPQNLVVGPPNPPQNSTPPQPLLIQVPNPPNVAAPLLPPRITQFPAQRMVLKPVRSSAGVQYYRKPDGTLVQLIPTSQLRPGNPSATIHGGNSEPQNLVGGPPNPPQNSTTPTDPQPLLIQLPNPPKVVNLLQPQITQFPGQRMVLKPVQSSAGVQYYRKPDGALVQLVTSNLPRSGNPPATVPGGDRSASCARLPPVAAVKRPALTNLSSSSSVVLPSPSPGASSSSSNPPMPPSVFLSPQNTCMFRIVPPHRVKDPIFIQLPFLPPTQIVGSERGLIRLQGPSQPVNYTPPDLPLCEKKDIPVERHDDSPQTLLTVQPAAHRGPSPLAQSPPPEPTPDCLGPKEEFAFDPMDLNVVFVDEVVDLVSSSETEDSSDFRESDSEDEKNQNAKRSKGDLKKKKKKQLRSHDENQSVLPPSAAGQAAAARTEVQGLIYISSEEESPKRKTVTNGTAAAAAGERTGDCQLGTGQQEAWSGTLENLEGNSGCGAAQQHIEMTINSDLEAEVDTGNSQRTQHHESNASCRKHRAQMKQTFLQLKREVLPADDSMSRTSLLEKAVQVIQELRSCEEDLKRKKRSLVRRRDEFLSILAPSAGDGQLGTGQQEAWSGTLENLEGNSGCGAAQQHIEMTINSNLEAEVDSPISPGTEQLGQAPQEVQKLPTEAESLWSNQSSKKEDNKDTHTEDVCSTPGTETLQHLLTNQKQPEMEGRQQTTNDVPEEGVLCVAIPTGDTGPLQAPPAAVQLQPLRQPVLHVSDGAPAPPDTKRIKTVPNILSRSRNRDLPQKMSAEKALPMDKVLFATPPGSTPHRIQELQPLLAAAPPAFLLVSAEPSQMGVPLPRLALPPQALALPPQGPAPPPHAAVPPPGLPYPPLDVGPSDPAGQMARQDSDNESLSSLLNEIVFLNQQTVATATTVVIDPPVAGGSEEQNHASEHPGPILGNANEGVLAPPPLLHMKVGGAKEAGLGSNNEATVGGAGATGVAWRPMPRLVPLGLRGNSPT